MAENRGTKSPDFLVEIGTEELPPKALRRLSEAFRDGVAEGLAGQRLACEAVEALASPRRLAVRARAIATRQPDIDVEVKGPPVKVAFDADGQPTRAGLAFAEKAGTTVDKLERVETPKGEWLVHRGVEQGRPAAELLPAIVQDALDGLPIPKPMRWGDTEAEFVRPVHWVVMLLGEDVVPGALFGLAAGRTTRGHRVHGQGTLEIATPADYEATLESAGKVVVDFGRRRAQIEAAVNAAAAEAGGTPVTDDALLDEVTSLVEWPVAVTGTFEEKFLELPPEVLIATLQDHQRYFPVRDAAGELVNRFVTVSNLESLDGEQVRHGNERVVRPRLADADFFWHQDRKVPLADRAERLAGVVFQRKLGTLADKSDRVAGLAAIVAELIGSDEAAARRAALLAKCDLVSDMVGEFPQLQGTMGRYYAVHDGEPDEVAAALEEQYMPRFAGDALPATATGQALAVAEKLDTIVGIFAIGQRPTGTKDPFGLRRSALGVLRILIEGGLDLNLMVLVEAAAGRTPVDVDRAALADEVFDYMMERLRAYYVDGAGEFSVSPELFESVLANRPLAPLDFHQRLAAVREFSRMDAAESLAAANKRIANILRQAGGDHAEAPDPERLVEKEERTLFDAVSTLDTEVAPLLADRQYRQALERLARLRGPVDEFFDAVMVMDEDPALRRNRLALLGKLRGLFLHTADVSRLSR